MEMRSESEIERSVEKLLQDLREIVHEGEELLKAGMEDSSERSSVAREKLSAALEAAKETQHRIQQRAAEGVRATDRVIREHPYQSMGVAFGVGLLIGVIACRK
jgi:ElaB/YqjD/DUF883 family membrane-anchored ribosome-binding protein